MANKSIIPIFVLIISGLSLIIVLPNIFFSSSLSSYGTIYESESCVFPENLSSKVDLNINVDVGNIKIEYIEPSIGTYGKIDVNFKMRGANLAGKSFTDYFSLDWQTTNSSANFTLKLLSESWYDSSLWSLKNVSIVVSLRKDIIFNIITTIDKGDFEITVPYGVSIGYIYTNVSTGNILYDFEYSTIDGNITGIVRNGDIFYDYNHCTIEGNITGIVNIGNILFQTFNEKYSRNLNWNFSTHFGDFDLFIHQYEDLKANITGKIHIGEGRAFVYYDDSSANIGASFEIPYGNGLMDKAGLPRCVSDPIIPTPCPLVNGFIYNNIISDYNDYDQGIIKFVSKDLVVNNVTFYYNITFEIIDGLFDDPELTSIN